jgi:hypothetical protein
MLHPPAKSPTVMDAIAALRSSLQEFGNGVGLLDDITSKIENFDDIGVEEAAEVRYFTEIVYFASHHSTSDRLNVRARFPR